MSRSFNLDAPTALQALKIAVEKLKGDFLNEDLARECAIKAWQLCDHVCIALGPESQFPTLHGLQNQVRAGCPELGYLQEICTEVDPSIYLADVLRCTAIAESARGYDGCDLRGCLICRSISPGCRRPAIHWKCWRKWWTSRCSGPRWRRRWATPTGRRADGRRMPRWPSMFEILVLADQHTASDERMEFLIRDRLSWMRFPGVRARGADARPQHDLDVSRARDPGAGVIDALFATFDRALREVG